MQTNSNNHVFHKGLKDSIDISKLSNDTWTFPTHNIRIYNKNGQGYIVTPIKGNTVNSGTSASPVVGGVDSYGAVMKTQDNYVIISAKEFNGIIYIISARNDGRGEGEIGVYPAPLSLLDPTVTGSGGFSGYPIATSTYTYGRYYAPLGNFNPTTLYAVYDSTVTYTNVAPDHVTYNNHTYECVVASTTGTFDPNDWKLISYLNSDLFNFTFLNQTEIEIKPFYDGSVNLYIVDYTNPNRVINSGFVASTGVLTDTVYNENDFSSTFNQILGVKKELAINSVEIIPKGAHKFGNYFFYLKYMNASLDKTDVVAASNACQIYAGTTDAVYKVEGGDGTSTTSPYSDKRVILNLDINTIDDTYTYISVIYSRYYGDASGVQLWETYEIAQPYVIADIVSTGKITIYGDEDVLDVDEGEILRIRGVENICKSQAQHGKRWWGANWKGVTLHDDTLTEFAKLIRITYDDTKTLSGAPVVRANPVLPIDTANSQYDDYNNTYDYVGYFRGEPYVFGVKFELNSGQVTEAYPMNGVDNYDLGYLPTDPNYDDYYDPNLLPVPLADANYEGRYRFPNSEDSNPYRAGNLLHLLAVKFDMTFAKTYLATATWIKNNVRGMWFVRMDRKENLIYQGLTLPGSKSYLCYDSGAPVGDTGIEYTLGSSPNYYISYDLPHSAIKLNLAPGQALNENTWLSRSTPIVCSDSDESYGQFVGKVTGNSDYFANYWGGIRNGGNNESDVNETAYKDLYYPIYSGYMPMWYYNKPNWRYYMSRWYHYLGKQCFFSPDYFLDKDDQLTGRTSIFIKHVARTQDFATDYWTHKTQTDYDATKYDDGSYYVDDKRDLCPLQVLTEVSDRYMVDNLLAAEECTNFYEIGKTGDVYNGTIGVGKYVNAGTDHAGLSSYDGVTNSLFWAHKNNAGNHQYWSNRSIRSQQYIGIDTSEDIDNGNENTKNYRLAIVNMYKSDPTVGVFDLLAWETSLYTKPLYNISDYIKLYDDDPTSATYGDILLDDYYSCYKGDCFLQRFYFKQAFFNCTLFSASGDDGTGGDAIGCVHYDDGVVPQMDEPDPSTIYNKNRYANGLVIGAVFEMKFNGNMRYRTGTGAAEYYPHADAWDWNIIANNLTGMESPLYNTGHHRVLDIIPCYIYNPNIPQAENIHPTRIRYSDQDDQYSVIDGYRNVMPLNYKDYDSHYNQIMKIVAYNNELISIQEDCINKHFTLEKDATVDMTSGEITAGSGDILSDTVRRVADFGTQHQHSVVTTDNGIYGVDAFRRIIWQAAMTTTTTGSYILGAADISKEKMIEKWLYEWMDEAQPITDIISRLPDTPVLGRGIVGVTDKKYKDVIFSFFDYDAGTPHYNILGITKFNYRYVSSTTYAKWQVIYNENDEKWYYSLQNTNTGNQPETSPTYWYVIDFDSMINYTSGMTVYAGNIIRCCSSVDAGRDRDCGEGYIFVASQYYKSIISCTRLSITINRIPINCCEDKSIAIVFNEDTKEFIDTVSYSTTVGVGNYSDFFTTGNVNMLMDSYLYRHDMPDYLWFYGSPEKMILSWYENGNNADSALSSYTKFFANQDIHGSEKDLYRIDYSTEYQSGEHFPFLSDTEFWRTPEYLEHHWKVPITVKSDADDEAFYTNSSMQGTWLLTTLTYKQNVETFIKNITTYFRNSYV